MEDQIDRKEFVKLIQMNKGIVYKICNSYCRNKHDREDLAQEIVYQLWISGHTFNDDFKFSTWMYRVALNVAISFYRKNKSTQALVSFTDNIIDIEDISDDFETEYEQNRKQLLYFIHELNEFDKALMILFLEAKNYKEIAEILGITETNVATKISRVKDKLKQRILTANK
ncbi:MAG: sigma-70 family RNA polymerase sigma factor [Bacteroidales bacterium]|nr:sigma-70 family RNA polymerase sigma factor [Bacteroidales bacterium]